MSESIHYFRLADGDTVEIDLLMTRIAPIRVTVELLKDIIEAHLDHIAAEHARIAMESYVGEETPMDIFDRSQTVAWDEILDRPMAPLNDFSTSKGEGFDFIKGSSREMERNRTASEWARILGVPINAPTFLQALMRWMAEVEAP
jgi:hypothetical protein